jgi:uncharacterized Rmd1/YagE family protein
MEKNVISYLSCETFSSDIFNEIANRYKATKYKDIITIELENDGVIVLFMFGVYVTWNVEYESVKFFQDFIKDFEEDSLQKPIIETLLYESSKEFKINFDKLILEDESILTKIAISTSLAQNIKLIDFEQTIQSTIEENSSIPKILADKGKINLSKKDTAKKMGELFLVRSKTNLHYDLLDTPEFFWDYPEYEVYYDKVTKYLDIKSRLEVLNKKVEIIQELFDMLSNEQHHRYSSFLEWIIIILIGVEIVMGLWEHIF